MDADNVERMGKDIEDLKSQVSAWNQQLTLLTDRVDKIAHSLAQIELIFQRIEHFWKTFLENLLKFLKTFLKWALGILTAGLGGAFVTYLVNHFHLIH